MSLVFSNICHTPVVQHSMGPYLVVTLLSGNRNPEQRNGVPKGTPESPLQLFSQGCLDGSCQTAGSGLCLYNHACDHSITGSRRQTELLSFLGGLVIFCYCLASSTPITVRPIFMFKNTQPNKQTRCPFA